MTMRALLLMLPFLFASFTPAARAQGGAAVEAFVTMQVDHMDEAEWTKVSARISSEAGANVEYVCLRAGILVLRLRDLKVSDRADVMALVKRLLHEGGVNGAIEFLDIHVEKQGPDRC